MASIICRAISQTTPFECGGMICEGGLIATKGILQTCGPRIMRPRLCTKKEFDILFYNCPHTLHYSKFLRLEGLEFDDEAIRSLLKFFDNHLAEITIQKTSITDDLREDLLAVSSLRHLNVVNCPDLTGLFFATLMNHCDGDVRICISNSLRRLKMEDQLIALDNGLLDTVALAFQKPTRNQNMEWTHLVALLRDTVSVKQDLQFEELMPVLPMLRSLVGSTTDQSLRYFATECLLFISGTDFVPTNSNSDQLVKNMFQERTLFDALYLATVSQPRSPAVFAAVPLLFEASRKSAEIARYLENKKETEEQEEEEENVYHQTEKEKEEEKKLPPLREIIIQTVLNPPSTKISDTYKVRSWLRQIFIKSQFDYLREQLKHEDLVALQNHHHHHQHQQQNSKSESNSSNNNNEHGKTGFLESIVEITRRDVEILSKIEKKKEKMKKKKEKEERKEEEKKSKKEDAAEKQQQSAQEEEEEEERTEEAEEEEMDEEEQTDFGNNFLEMLSHPLKLIAFYINPDFANNKNKIKSIYSSSSSNSSTNHQQKKHQDEQEEEEEGEVGKDLFGRFIVARDAGFFYSLVDLFRIFVSNLRDGTLVSWRIPGFTTNHARPLVNLLLQLASASVVAKSEGGGDERCSRALFEHLKEIHKEKGISIHDTFASAEVFQEIIPCPQTTTLFSEKMKKSEKDLKYPFDCRGVAVASDICLSFGDAELWNKFVLELLP